MKLCFVAKDEEEFVRYLKGQTKIPEVKSLNSGFRQDPPSLKILAKHEIYKHEKRKVNTGWFSLCAVNDQSHGLQVYVMLADDNLKTFIRENITNVLKDDEVRGKSERFLKAIAYCSQPNVEQQTTVSFEDDTFLFIHWGGGDPSWYEEQFQPFCDEYFNGARAFALSSRRRELFNVTASEIILPKTEADARELVDSFSFARIKNLLAEYVVTYFSNLRKGQEIESPSFGITDPRFSCPLQSFFCSQKKRLEARSRLSEIDKRRLAAFQDLVGLNWGAKVPQLPYKEETSELFTSLIREKGRV